MIRIGLDAKRYFLNRTGLGNYSRWLIQSLKQHSDRFEPFLYHRVAEKVKGLQVKGPNKALHRKFPALWRSKWICKDLLHDQIAIYHGLSNELPRGIHQTGIKTVVTIHDLIQKRYPENYSRIDRNIYNRKVNYAQKHADCIVVPSLQTKKDLIRFFHTDAERIRVIPLGMAALPDISNIPSEQGDYVLCVSSFNRRKNVLRLIKAFQTDKLKDVQLIIAGQRGDTYQRALVLASKSSNITLLADPDSEKIHSLYRSAQFCVYPSHFEGFGIPVLEAFQHGKTLALSKKSSLPEVGGDAVLYFNPEDVDAMSRCIGNLYFSRKQREHLESLIPAQRAKFESERVFAQYSEMYLNLL